jgi:hypothetical protein
MVVIVYLVTGFSIAVEKAYADLNILLPPLCGPPSTQRLGVPFERVAHHCLILDWTCYKEWSSLLIYQDLQLRESIILFILSVNGEVFHWANNHAQS